MEKNYTQMTPDEKDALGEEIQKNFEYWCKGQNAPFDPGLISEDIYWKENITKRYSYDGINEMKIIDTPPMLKSYLTSSMALKEYYIKHHKILTRKYNKDLKNLEL